MYRSYVLRYLQQLAIITPYADIDFSFHCAEAKRRVALRYARRSDQMPPQPKLVKYHPHSLDHLLTSQLLKRTKAKSLTSFLRSDMAGVSGDLSKRLVAELGPSFDETPPRELDGTQAERLTRVLSQVKAFSPPDGGALSPAGEYNLRLGVEKELRPEFVATHTPKAGQHQGHAFVVEGELVITTTTTTTTNLLTRPASRRSRRVHRRLGHQRRRVGVQGKGRGGQEGRAEHLPIREPDPAPLRRRRRRHHASGQQSPMGRVRE